MTQVQRAMLVEWAAAKLDIDETRRRALGSIPPFLPSYLQLKWARKTADINFQKYREELIAESAKSGYRTWEARVLELEATIELLKRDVFGGRHWCRDVKEVAGEIVRVERFNEGLIKQWRGLFDDVARETGGRASKVDISLDVTKLSDEELRRIVEGASGGRTGTEAPREGEAAAEDKPDDLP